MNPINHDDPRWTDFALGELPKDEIERLRTACENHTEVLAVVSETNNLAALLRDGFRKEGYELGEARREAIRKAGRIPAPEAVVAMRSRRREWVRPAAVAAVAAGIIGGGLWVMQQIPVGNRGGAAISNSEESSHRALVRRQILLGGVPQVIRSTAGGEGSPVSNLREEGPVVLPDVPSEFIEEEYLALRQLWDENPAGFVEEVQNAAQNAQLSLLSHIAPLADNPFISAASKPRSIVPVVSGTASYQAVERFIRGEMRLPPRGSVRIEELINHLAYDDDEGATLGQIKLSVEVASCPWDPELILMAVLLQNESGVVVASDADVIITMDPDLVRSYRLIGYAGREDPEVEVNTGPSSTGLAPGKSNYVLYQIRPQSRGGGTIPGIMARVSLRARGDTGELIVPVSIPSKKWVLASSNLKTAAALAAWGMVLRQSPFGGPLTHFDVGQLAGEALDVADVSRLKRREALQLILDSLPLFEVNSGS